MAKRRPAKRLGHRERQIMDAIYRLQEASVGEVQQEIENPPSYSAVRKMINVLEEKGLLSHRRDGTKYIYKPTQSRSFARRSAAKKLLATFFSGSAAEAVNTILDVSAKDLTDEDFEQLRAIIERAKKEGK